MSEEKEESVDRISDAIQASIDELSAEPEADEETTEEISEEEAETEDIDEDETGDEEPLEADSDDSEESLEAEDEVEEESEPVEVIEPPISLSAEDKEQFAKWSPDVQQAFKSRLEQVEKGAQQRVAEAAEKERQYQGLNDLFKDRDQRYMLQGVSREQVIGQLLAAQDYLDSNPVEGLKWLAQSYGLSLDELAQPTNEENYNPEIASLKQELGQVRGMMSEQMQSQQEAHKAAVAQASNEWAAEAGSDGKLLRPHMADNAFVTGEFIPQLQLLQSQMPNAHITTLLNQAYDRAVRLNPDLFQKMIDDEVAKRSAAKPKPKIKAAKAKAAGASISGAPSGSPKSRPDKMSVESAMKLAMEGKRV